MLKVNKMASVLRLPPAQNLFRNFSSVCAIGCKKAQTTSLHQTLSRCDHHQLLHRNSSSLRSQVFLDNGLYRLKKTSNFSTLLLSRVNGIHHGVPLQCLFTRTFFTSPSIRSTTSLFLKNHCLLQSQSNLAYSSLPHGRFYSSGSQRKGSQQGFSMGQKNKSVMMYFMAIFIFAIGVTYAAVPLYSVFCQATGYGGSVKQGHDTSEIETMKPIRKRPILINFNADTAAAMRWNFRPQQREVVVYPGETALAFYSAINPTDKPIVGISTYNVVPFEAGKYFNKIQCFCFEEQRLNPYEQVDMPVFFFIDPEFAADAKMDKVENIILSYTFFEAKEGLQLPDPMERR